MQGLHFLLLMFSSVIAPGSTWTDDGDIIDFAGFLKSIYPGFLVRDEPLVSNQEVNLDVPESVQTPEGERVEQGEGSGPLVLTKDGQIRGLTLDKAHVFYGVPFAGPPTGAYRWKPPRPVKPWSGVYDATFPRAACMQACAGPITEECPRQVSEDCLYLNIFVPLDVNLSVPLWTPLPVLVWIHGGDFIAGSASKPLYDGRFLSNFTRSVVVSMDYRLGAFGFLVSGKDHRSSAVGNYGILDQQAALLWVQRNIAVFGGDPGRVTIFGESAGAQSVSLHLMIQSSGPLFKQAVLQSLPFSIPLKSRHDAVKLGKSFARQTNCSVSDLVCLLSLSAQDVLAAQMKTSARLVNPFRFLEVFETWGPFVDGDLVKEQAVEAFQKGDWQKDKPVLLGTTSEEGVLFVYAAFNKPVSAVESTVYITAIFKQHALRVLHQYLPLYRDADRRGMLAQIVTDYIFLCPARRSARSSVASGSHVWMYVFDHVMSDHRLWSGLSFCYQHVCHGAELPFVFNSAPVANLSMTPPERLLSNRMLCYWGGWAHGVDPSGHVGQTGFCREQRLPLWPQYSDTSGWLVMNLTVRSHAQVGTRDHICDFWDKLDIY